MSNMESWAALMQFIDFYNLRDVTFFTGNIIVMKNEKLLENTQRTVHIERNTYNGWAIIVEDLKNIVGHERYSVDFQAMLFDGKFLTIYSDGCKININL